MQRRYLSQVVPVAALPECTVKSMAGLYLDNYEGTSPDLFRSDLGAKDEAILILCEGQLVGFTLLQVYTTNWRSRCVRIVYSGDTIVSPAHWGQQELAFAWIARAGQIWQQQPRLPLYWFLLVKGHRTFKYLPVFAKSFYPHWSEPRDDLKALAEQLASEKFGGSYDAKTGIVRFDTSRGHLKEAIAHCSEQELAKPATAFFLQKNPHYRLGHELVCLCELEPVNLKPLTARLFRRSKPPVCATAAYDQPTTLAAWPTRAEALQ